MKILMVTETWDLKHGPAETFYCNYKSFLNEKGHEVAAVDNMKNYIFIGGHTMWDYPAWLGRLRWGKINNHIINIKLRRISAQMQPDLILIIKGENIFSKTITWLKANTCAAIVNWDPDNPFWWSNTSTELLRSMPLFDAFGTWSRAFFPALASIGCRRVEYWPMFFNVERFRLDNKPPDPDEAKAYHSDIAFVGNGSPERAEMLRHLLDFDLALWGPWKCLEPEDPLRNHIRGAYLDGKRYAQVMRQTKIGVNVMNMQCRGASNLRTFETTGLGTMLLTEYSEEQARDLFVEDREIVCFRSPEELREKAKYYLQHEVERRQIALAGQQRTMREHTLKHRIESILEVTNEILATRHKED